MIDWEKLAVQLAGMVGSYSRTKERIYREQARELAAGIQVLHDLEEKTKDKLTEQRLEPKRVIYEKLFDEYLALVRLANETAARLDKIGGQ